MEKKTKIVCTIGPATWDQEIVRQMVNEGMNCARVNGAFADPDELDKVKSLVKNVSDKVSLMVDVKGPEVRMNKFPEPKNLKAGDILEIGNDDTAEVYPANYKNVYSFVKPGQRVVVGDGDVEMVIKEIRGTTMICEVVFGEVLKPGKALNFPGSNFAVDILTDKDKLNLTHAIQTGWDIVSASFVQNASAAKYIKDFLGNSPMKLFAKIEDMEGVNNIEQILEVVDGVIIARGGLGVELGLEKVPMIQKLLIEKCNAAGKAVITATQMLESMTINPRPTRAEANDVATAIMQGTDAVMLSGESSSGKYPVEAVRFLSKIAVEVEKSIEPRIIKTRAFGVGEDIDAISKSAAELCISMRNSIDKVIAVSRTGRAARLIGRHSIKQPIYALVMDEFNARVAMINKGVNDAFTITPVGTDRDEAIKVIVDRCKELNIVASGDRILLVSKAPLDETPFFPNLFEVIKI